jgi:hypothetical protein
MRMVAYPEYRGDPEKELEQPPFAQLEAEKERLRRWLAQPENRRLIQRDPREIRRFNQDPEHGPKSKHLRWYPMHREERESWEETLGGRAERPGEARAALGLRRALPRGRALHADQHA